MTDSQRPYLDSTLDTAARADDLLGRMSLTDKAGLLFQPIATVGDVDQPGFMEMPSVAEFLRRGITHFNVLQAPSARELAEWSNEVQSIARRHPLRVPVTISTDPRHSFADNPQLSLFAGPFSQWPETLGFAAIGDVDRVREFARVVRDEYLATGLRLALHPQLDIFSEPRWARGAGTWGTDPKMIAEFAAAYIEELQVTDHGGTAISTMAKHFPGGGPQKDGEDPHWDFGKEQIYPNGQFELHLEPFRAAIAAGVSQIMPYYGVPVGLVIDGEPVEEVGFAFNRQIITGVLRERLGFEGIVCTDWTVLHNTCWGVEELTFDERMVKALDAGVDQFGGEFDPDALVRLVESGHVTEARVDQSARRLLEEKFRLGLFDEPMVDVETVALHFTDDARERGIEVQAEAHVVVTNGKSGQPVLPLERGLRVFLVNTDPSVFKGRAYVVDTPEEADVAVVRLDAPWEPRGDGFAAAFHRGSLAFPSARVDELRRLNAVVPTIASVYLDRPALLGDIVSATSSILANFGAGSEALARVLFGEVEPRGRLPFEIPSSMDEVNASHSDTPNDTTSPAFPMRHGLSI